MAVQPIFSDDFYGVRQNPTADFGVQNGTITVLHDRKKPLSQRVLELFIGRLADPVFHALVDKLNQIQTSGIHALENEVHEKGYESSISLRLNVQCLETMIAASKPTRASLFMLSIVNIARSIFHCSPITVPTFPTKFDDIIQATYEGLVAAR